MGKNSGADKVRQQTNSTFDDLGRKNAQQDDWLKQLFGGSYGKAQDLENDAYGKYNDIYSQFGNVYNRFGDAASTGLLDSQGQEARDLYSNFIKTGGMSEQDKQNFRARAVAPIRGMYDSLSDEQKNQAVINPYGTGFGERLAKLSRQRGQQMGEVAQGAEAGITDIVNRNKLAGAQGATDFWGRLSGNKLAGMQGMNAAAGGQLSATQGIAGLSENEMKFAQNVLDNIQSNNALDANTKSKLLEIMTQQNPRVSLWDRVMQVVGIVQNGMKTAATMGA